MFWQQGSNRSRSEADSSMQPNWLLSFHPLTQCNIKIGDTTQVTLVQPGKEFKWKIPTHYRCFLRISSWWFFKEVVVLHFFKIGKFLSLRFYSSTDSDGWDKRRDHLYPSFVLFKMQRNTEREVISQGISRQQKGLSLLKRHVGFALLRTAC